MKLVCFHKWVEKPVYNHGGEFSHLDIRCPKCKRRFEQRQDRLTGKRVRVEVQKVEGDR